MELNGKNYVFKTENRKTGKKKAAAGFEPPTIRAKSEPASRPPKTELKPAARGGVRVQPHTSLREEPV